jgi:hypothetical protein
MEILKRLILFTIATIVAIFLLVWSLDSFGFQSPVFAFLVNWLVMSWVAVNGQVVHLSFAPSYYDIKPFEQTGQVYERLGIRLFKRLVRRGPLSMFSPTLRFPKDKTIPALRTLETEMRKAETGHVLIFVVMLLFVCYALLQGWLDAVAWMLLFDILINGYPIMLQRYNRIKLQELVLQQEVGFIEEKETHKIHGKAAQ